jgi:uncharacterized protein (TIGR00304 family)
MYTYIAFIGMLLIIAGFIAIFIYIIINSLQPNNASQNSSVNAAGLIMIGPIPVAFGTSPGMVAIVEILAIVLMVVAILFFFIFARR